MLAGKFVSSRIGARSEDESAAFAQRALPFAGAASTRAPERGVLPPIAELAAGGDELGFVNIRPDADRVYHPTTCCAPGNRPRRRRQ